MKFIPYGKQSISEEDIQAVAAALRSDFITQGPLIQQLEEKLAAYCGAGYALVFNSGTAALHAAYFVSGLQEGDEFITTPNTFVATANAGLYLGAKPVFVDVEPDTGNMNPALIADKITKNTKMIAPVHYAGNPVNLSHIREIAAQHKLHVVEDASHAIGAKYQGSRIGACQFSDMTVFSFHPVKHITTGEGGALLTNNPSYYEIAAQFRTHGITKEQFIKESDGDWYYEMHHLGFNYRMTDIQAALGISQLNRLNSFIERRRKIVETYTALFSNNPFFDLPVEQNGVLSAFHLYPIRLKDHLKAKKKAIFSKLREQQLGVQVHYIPVYLQPYYQQLGYRQGSCPHAEDFYQKEISLPMYPELTDEDIETVQERLFYVLKQYQ